MRAPTPFPCDSQEERSGPSDAQFQDATVCLTRRRANGREDMCCLCSPVDAVTACRPGFDDATRRVCCATVCLTCRDRTRGLTIEAEHREGVVAEGRRKCV